MKSGKPWSLSDVDEETRKALLKAAEQSGLSVSEWLGHDAEDDYPSPIEIDPDDEGDHTNQVDYDDDADPGSRQLGEAIARLTKRLGALDEKARESAGDLKSRLANIEHRLGEMADSRETGAAREQSLTSIAEAIDRLVQDLDNLDERARSMVEGLSARTERPSSTIDQAAARDGDHDQDFGAMGSPAAPSDNDIAPSGLDDIRHRLDDLLAESPNPNQEPPPRAATIEAALRPMEDRIDEAKARLSSASESQPLAQSSSAADHIERIEARLNEISGRLPQGKDVGLASAIREISAHQRTIDDRAETAAMREDQKALVATIAALRADMGSLTEQVTAMGRNGAENQGAVFDLTRRIDALVAERPLDRTVLNQIRADVDALKERIGAGSDPSAIANLETHYGELAGRLEEVLRKIPDRFRLDALGEEVSALRRALEADDGVGAIARDGADIARLEQRLDEIAGSLSGLMVRAPVNAVSPTVAGLEKRLAEMTAAIEGLISRSPSGEGGGDVEQLERRLDEMAAGIGDRLAAGASASEAAPDIARFEERLDDIADSIKGLYMGAPVGTSAGRLEDRLDKIASGIEGLLHRAPAVADIETLHDRIQSLAERIDGLKVPQTDIDADLDDIKTEVASIRAVHQRLQTLTERIDGLSATQHEPLLAIAEIKDGITAIKGLHARMQTLTDRIDRMSANQHESVPAVDQMKTSIAAMRAVHERLEALGERIDSLGVAREPAVALDELTSGIAAIQATHERLQNLAERIDGMAVEREPGLALDEIKTGIAAIRSEIAGRGAPNTEHLENQIRELAARLESGTHAQPEAPALVELEAQVAGIAKALESNKPQTATLKAIEERVDRLQTHLAGTQKDSVEAARHEAREAVRELSDMVAGNQVDSDLIGAVMQDLDALRSTAGDTDQRIRAKLESVNQTLTQVVARLSRLENEATSEPSQATGTYGATYSALGTEPSHPAPGAEPSHPAPGAEPSAEAWTSAFHGDDDGVGMPAREGPGEPWTASSEEATDDRQAHERRADFIAAARRAVQAAAVEATANINEGESKQRKPGAFSRISQAIRNRKRTLLLAAAAIVLAVSAMHTYRGLPAHEDDAEVIAAAGPEEEHDTAALGDIVAEAAPVTPTVPQVTDSALVAPSFTPDREVAFAEPVLGTYFQPTTTGSVADQSGDADEEVAVAGLADEALPVDVASAGEESEPAAAEPPRLDPRIGSPTLVAAAENGNPTAMFEVAARYAEGDRVPKNLAKAAEWYERAAEGGVAVAQYRIGSLYERGQGVAKDLTKAVNWYQRAADQGNVNAMHNLAVLMSEGVDGPPDRAKALQWFLAAANYGVRDSQYNLGVIYARGLGPDQDLVESYKWFAIAAAQGDNDAAGRRDEVAGALQPDDLAGAQAALQAWRVKASLAEANGVSAPDGGWDAPEQVIGEVDREALVKKIQTLLAEQGFDPGPADGIAGPKTRQAVKAFQRKVGAPETGQIDGSLMAALSDD